MAKPRVFISSTYYDLKYVRAALDEFVRNLGFEPVLFEKGDIPFQHDTLLEDACLNEVDIADIFVLLIGGRYGSLSVEDVEERSTNPDSFFTKVRSITRKEYEKARSREIPLYIFVEDSVLSEYRTFQKNRTNKEVNYAHVDDVRIFLLIEDIYGERLNNYVKGFSRTEEIISWLRDQWAGIFADFLRRTRSDRDLTSFSLQLSQLTSVVQSLQSYSETIVRKTEPQQAEHLIIAERLKQKSNLADAVCDSSVIRWFSGHETTREVFNIKDKAVRYRILDEMRLSDGIIEFLTAMGVDQEKIVSSTIGVEDRLFKQFSDLKRALEISGTQPDDTAVLEQEAVPKRPRRRRTTKRV